MRRGGDNRVACVGCRNAGEQNVLDKNSVFQLADVTILSNERMK